MKGNLKLDVKDFGPINNANININKINIVGGSNASGKSTLSKLLFCFLISASSEGNLLVNNSIKDQFRNIIYKNVNPNELGQMLNIIDDWDDREIRSDYFLEKLSKIKLLYESFGYDNKTLNDDFKNIEELIYKNDDILFRLNNMTNFLFNSEFNNSQLSDFNQNSKVIFSKEDEKGGNGFYNSLEFFESNVNAEISQDYLKSLTFNNICYVDSLSFFDSKNKYLEPYHITLLENKLKNKTILSIYSDELNKKVFDFENEISDMIGGKFVFLKSDNKFVFRSNGFDYELKNTASGYKQIGIIQLLLSNKNLNENSFLIIDEPELNLHPKFQIDIAKILLKMVKDLNVSLFINSHSPFFIEAFEVFSETYGLEDKINFFLAEESNVNNKFNFYEIDRKDLDEVYSNLGSPFDIINIERMNNDLKRGRL